MALYEIEIKSLLGDASSAENLKAKMKQTDPNFVELGSHKQLNHYFHKGNLKALSEAIAPHLEPSAKEEINESSKLATEFSVRTREADGVVLVVVKVTVDQTSSSNGTARREFEEKVQTLSLKELDQLILNAGFEYQAKWSRERQEFNYKGIFVTIDKNAGYGYLAEFEKQIDDPSEAESVKNQLRLIMSELGISELSQARLERMFEYYNSNWAEYYGTDKIFNIQ